MNNEELREKALAADVFNPAESDSDYCKRRLAELDEELGDKTLERRALEIMAKTNHLGRTKENGYVYEDIEEGSTVEGALAALDVMLKAYKGDGVK